jgi:hypothetical protein
MEIVTRRKTNELVQLKLNIKRFYVVKYAMGFECGTLPPPKKEQGTLTYRSRGLMKMIKSAQTFAAKKT